MDEKKQFWVDVVEGRISVPRMLKITRENPELLQWLTDIAPENTRTVAAHDEMHYHEGDAYEAHSYPFDAALQIQACLHDERGADAKLSRYLSLHTCLCRVMTAAFPEDDLKVDWSLDERYCFMLEVCPSYIGGHQVDHILEEELDLIPRDLPRHKRIQLYKKRLRERFHLKYRHPEWVMDPEWPAGVGGTPMKFLRQMRVVDKEHGLVLAKRYFFQDVHTGEKLVVEQTYSD